MAKKIKLTKMFGKVDTKPIKSPKIGQIQEVKASKPIKKTKPIKFKTPKINTKNLVL